MVLLTKVELGTAAAQGSWLFGSEKQALKTIQKQHGEPTMTGPNKYITQREDSGKPTGWQLQEIELNPDELN